MERIKIKNAEKSDIGDILGIYSYYVTDTAVSFEYEAPSYEEFLGRFVKISSAYPYLAAELDGKIAGYAYASQFHERKAYSHSAELTVYISKDLRGHGIGKALYSELFAILPKMNITNVYACIAVPEYADEYLTSDSIDFHRHMGFEEIGRFHRCGYKFGKWYDMVWAEKFIGKHSANMPEIIKYDKLIHGGN